MRLFAGFLLGLCLAYLLWTVYQFHQEDYLILESGNGINIDRPLLTADESSEQEKIKYEPKLTDDGANPESDQKPVNETEAIVPETDIAEELGVVEVAQPVTGSDEANLSDSGVEEGEGDESVGISTLSGLNSDEITENGQSFATDLSIDSADIPNEIQQSPLSIEEDNVDNKYSFWPPFNTQFKANHFCRKIDQTGVQCFNEKRSDTLHYVYFYFRDERDKQVKIAQIEMGVGVRLSMP